MDIQGLRDHIARMLRERLNPHLCYHDLDHTLDVCASAIKLARIQNIDSFSTRLLTAAALLHDSGMMVRYENHEEGSAEIARQILPEFGFLSGEIDQVCNMILYTRMPHIKASPLASILCDADLDYVGRNDFFIRSFQLRLEWDLLGVRTCSMNEWLRFQVEFLESHHFLSPAALQLRSEGKEKNLALLKKMTYRNNHP